MIPITSMSSNRSGTEEEAYQVLGKWTKAFTNSDVETIVDIFAPDALMIGTAGKVVMTTPSEIRKYFEWALLNNRPRTATISSSEVMAVNESVVIVTGLDAITGVKDGQPTAGMGRVTFVLAKCGLDWKIVHLHRSPLPA